MTDFERFFDSQFQKLLADARSEGQVLSSGMNIAEASWDRKAAFLLWKALGEPSPPKPRPIVPRFEDLLG